MKNISTLVYTINDFENQQDEVYDADSLFDHEDFADVYQYLNQIESAPSDACMKKIFDFAKS